MRHESISAYELVMLLERPQVFSRPVPPSVLAAAARDAVRPMAGEAVASGTEWTPSADELLGGIKVLLRGQVLEAVSLGDLRYSLARHLGVRKSGGHSDSSGRHTGSIRRAFESKKRAFSLEERGIVPGA